MRNVVETTLCCYLLSVLDSKESHTGLERHEVKQNNGCIFNFEWANPLHRNFISLAPTQGHCCIHNLFTALWL